MQTRAAVLRELGLPRPYADSRPFSIEDVELDDPGPREVRVAVGAAGLCHSDLSVLDGSRPRALPVILGHEAAGVVESVGEGVDSVVPGDRVVFSFVPMCGRCEPCLTGRPALCVAGTAANMAGTLLGGGMRIHAADGDEIHPFLGVSGYAAHTVCSDASLVPLPDGVPLTEGALFGCALLTGVGAVLNTAGARPGTAAAVFGLGGVGLSAVMGARIAGCDPIIAVDTREDKLERAQRLGATHGVLAGAGADDQIKAIAPGGVDCAFEAVGSGAVLAAAYAAVRRGGKAVSIGLPPADDEFTIPALSLAANEKQVLGSFMGSSVPRRDIPRLARLNHAGLLPLADLTTGLIGLGDINAGFDALASGDAVRQVIDFGLE